MANFDLDSGGGATKIRSTNHHYYYYPPSYFLDSTERQWTPWLVPMILVANISMFIVIMFVNDCPKNNLGFHGGECVATFLGRLSFQPLKENPLFGPSTSTLDKLGALEWRKVHQGWRLFSCMWLHAGVFHLLANMLSLGFIGVHLEQHFGFVRVGTIYILSGFGGSILSLLFIHQDISVGASGALFGLIGAMLSELLTNWTIYTNKACALLTMFTIIAVNLALGILPHVDNFAQIGGFLTGFLLGFTLLLRSVESSDDRVESKHTVFQWVSFYISWFLLIGGFSIGLVMLFRGENVNRHCSWCHYMSCVHTSRWNCGN
ncbi:RHOMBOID-like protein 2 [Impatiens glandulifera]|uniref:RHOMBOID-like protein 2 n=1 Tax=Impatiens glandulifera TaxID=253017 RepID=UPI001FB064C0|nr:RHOMBOID-like protein 2 [Impatiens glandulifera]